MQEEDRRCIAKGERKLHLLAFLTLRHLRLELQDSDKSRFIYDRQRHHLLLHFAVLFWNKERCALHSVLGRSLNVRPAFLADRVLELYHRHTTCKAFGRFIVGVGSLLLCPGSRLLACFTTLGKKCLQLLACLTLLSYLQIVVRSVFIFHKSLFFTFLLFYLYFALQ